MNARAACLLLVGLFLLPPVPAAATWEPPQVEENGWDWIRLNSGEWLGGKITRLRDLDLEFDSEELDDLKIDLGDVAEIRSPRILTWGFEGSRLREQVEATGPATLRDGVVRIRLEGTDGEIAEFRKRDLISIIEGRPRELNYWSLKANASLITRSGNTDQTDFNTYALVRRETTRSRTDGEYTGNFGKVTDTVTINNQRGRLDASILLRRGLFLTPFTGEAFSDEFQNIEVRYTVGAGAGIFLVRNSETDLWFSLTGGYQSTRYISVAAGEDIEESNGSVTPSLTLETDVTKTLELDVSYDAQIGVPDAKKTFHHAKLLFSLDAFGDIVDFTFSVQWDRNENPRENAEGITPAKDDFRTAFGLGVDF